MQEIREEIASLEEQKKLSEKLQLKDSKCPVCDSIVEKLNPLFQNKNLKEEIKKLREEIDLKKKEEDNHCQEKLKLQTNSKK